MKVPWASTTEGGLACRITGECLGIWEVKNRIVREAGIDPERVRVRIRGTLSYQMVLVDVDGIDAVESSRVRSFLRHVLPSSWHYSVNSPEHPGTMSGGRDEGGRDLRGREDEKC
jgi:hypothetical protein